MRVVYYFVDAIYVTRSKFGRVTTETRDTTRQKRFVDARPVYPEKYGFNLTTRDMVLYYSLQTSNAEC